MSFTLSEANYHSQKANREYMSNSQYVNFMECEARALAEINGEYVREVTDSMLVGSYVDAHFSGTLDLFKAQTPAIFTQKGDLMAEYKHANTIISRIEKDAKMMQYLSGKWQVIRTGEIAGIPWKIKIDVLHDEKCLVDLKIVKDVQPIWSDEIRVKLPWIEHWGYHRQGAIYQHIEGNRLPFIIAAATKEKSPDIGLLSIPQDVMDIELEKVMANAPRFEAIKRGEIEPVRCEKCAYCRETKKLDKILDYREM